MCRGNARQRIFQDEADHQRLVDGLAVTVSRYGWELFSFVLRAGGTCIAKIQRVGCSTPIGGGTRWPAKGKSEPR